MLADQRSGDARTYVEIKGGVGSAIRGGLPGVLLRNAPGPVNCVLLAQLGLDVRFQGEGLSR